MALPFLSDAAYGQEAVEEARASCTGCGMVTRVSRYLSQPFVSTAENTPWWIFIGAVLLAAFLWSRVLRSIISAID